MENSSTPSTAVLSVEMVNQPKMKYGDCIIMQDPAGKYHIVILRKEGSTHNMHGCFYHSDFVGKKFGSKVCQMEK